MNHTQEPWFQSGIGDQKFIRYHSHALAGAINICEMNINLGEYKENADRIVKCVNACQGVEDPEKFIQEAHDRLLDEANFNQAADLAIKETEDARACLIKEGIDPDEVGKQGATFVRTLSAKMRLEVQLKEALDQRDQAWKDDKEIRAIIGADENESTVDEVQSLLLNFRRAKDQMYKVKELLDGIADEFNELVNIVRPGENAEQLTSERVYVKGLKELEKDEESKVITQLLMDCEVKIHVKAVGARDIQVHSNIPGKYFDVLIIRDDNSGSILEHRID